MTVDEADAFTEDEFVAAFEIIADSKRARRFAREIKQPRASDDLGASWQLAPDVLDLLSLVSADAATRVAAILQLTPEEAHTRRQQVAQRFRKRIDY